MFSPGQVNNVYIFPGMSMGAVCCKASRVPERLFMVAAEAVANSLDSEDLMLDRVVPNPNNIRSVGLNVAAAVAFEAQNLGIASKTLGKTLEEVKAVIKEMMWSPACLPKEDEDNSQKDDAKSGGYPSAGARGWAKVKKVHMIRKTLKAFSFTELNADPEPEAKTAMEPKVEDTLVGA